MLHAPLILLYPRQASLVHSGSQSITMLAECVNIHHFLIFAMMKQMHREAMHLKPSQVLTLHVRDVRWFLLSSTHLTSEMPAISIGLYAFFVQYIMECCALSPTLQQQPCDARSIKLYTNKQYSRIPQCPLLGFFANFSALSTHSLPTSSIPRPNSSSTISTTFARLSASLPSSPRLRRPMML